MPAEVAPGLPLNSTEPNEPEMEAAAIATPPSAPNR